MTVMMMSMILTEMAMKMWRIPSPAPRIVVDTCIDTASSPRTTRWTRAMTLTPTTTWRTTSLPPAKAISRRTCSHSHGHGPVPPSASYESQLRPTAPIILIIATPHLPVRPTVAAMVFCCKKCWSIHPHFFDDDNIYLGGIIVQLASSGVWDDCLGGWRAVVSARTRRVTAAGRFAPSHPRVRTFQCSHRLSFSFRKIVYMYRYWQRRRNRI